MLFLEYKHRAMREIDRFALHAANLKSHFDDGSEIELLLDSASRLQAEYDSLVNYLPDGTRSDNLIRHLRFLDYHLKRGTPAGCKQDIEDICGQDIPALRQAITQDRQLARYDQELEKKVQSLLVQQELDSAIRKAFVILKERLVSHYGLPSDLDGSALLNTVYGPKGVVVGKMPDADRAARRNLLDGLYGVFRNQFGHRDIVPEWHEAAAVIGMINWFLLDLPESSPVHASDASEVSDS